MSQTSIEERGHRKERIGEVVSNKMEKTIVVKVERRYRHPQYRKVVTSFKKLYAHDETKKAQVGDSGRLRAWARSGLATRCASKKPARCPSSRLGGWWTS